MPTTLGKFEHLVTRVRTLPEARQQAAVEALAEIAEEFYQLSDDELRTLQPALDRGEFVPDDEFADLLDKSWR
jgi:hypothetical protein